MYRIESFLAARLFVTPQIVGDRIFFISNLSGHLSLYAMEYGGSVPEPLLPPNIALQNPELLEGGLSFFVFPRLGKIMVMIDNDGDENYQPMLIPIDGGFPEPAFDNYFAEYRCHLGECDIEKNILYIAAERRDKPIYEGYQCNLVNGQVTRLAESSYGAFIMDRDDAHIRVLIGESYTLGDNVLSIWESGQKKLLYGKPLESRADGEVVPPNGLESAVFSPSGKGVVVTCALFSDRYSLGYTNLAKPGVIEPVELDGVAHSGVGEMVYVSHLKGTHYLVSFNIDGCDWLYEAVFNEEKRIMKLRYILVGPEPLDNGKLEHVYYDKTNDRFVASFSTATSPTQIYTIEDKDRETFVIHTNERLLGIPESHLSKGEDASFESFDGLRVSARLYMPADELGFEGPRPVVCYIHGGPQSQERPDFAWFSMPLIQFLTLRGFAVFVPNVRGSTGYGLEYTKKVDLDWGGDDRLDHVHAITKVLSKDKRLDVKRAAIVGRSYGGYMTLMLAGRHPDLWAASCDMFGPYDLVTFSERIPETWKPYFKLSIGDPETPDGLAHLKDRSPKTYLNNLGCPMLVIQGRNDPRVVAAESEDLVNELKKAGKEMELLIFEDEGHDVLKYENRVLCYNAITDFFAERLKP